MKFTNLSICIIVVFFGCKNVQSLKSQNVTYDLVINYGEIDQTRRPYIIYKKKIFEFIVNNTEHIKTSVSEGSLKNEKEIIYDTVGIQIIDLANNHFVLINSFNKEFIIKDHGDYDTSKIGFKPSFSRTSTIKKESSLRDTLINNTKLKYETKVEKNSRGEDSLIMKTFCIQNNEFISVFTPSFESSNLQFYGFSVALVKENYTFSMLINDLKTVSSDKERICAQIIAKLDLSKKNN